jgi:uncharacterized protein YutE (UPF0331/DUF86 family)
MQEELTERLVRHLGFLEEELKDFDAFRKLSWEEYHADRDKRRNIERWIENLVNSTVDIARIVLCAEGKQVPGTYREMVSSLGFVTGFDPRPMTELSRWTSLRNILSHEYLDVKWASIKRFVAEGEPLCWNLLENARSYLKQVLGARPTTPA